MELFKKAYVIYGYLKVLKAVSPVVVVSHAAQTDFSTEFLRRKERCAQCDFDVIGNPSLIRTMVFRG